MRKAAIGAGCLLLAATAMPAVAAHQLVQTVGKNKPTLITYNYYFRGDCSAGPRPTASITRAPTHGTLRMVPGSGVIAEENRCKGSPSQSIGILYTPARGYTGPDSFSVHWRSADGVINQQRTYTFQVR